MATDRKVGKAGIGGEILLRKPGDLPAHCVEPADGVFRDGERTVVHPWFAHLIAFRQEFELGIRGER